MNTAVEDEIDEDTSSAISGFTDVESSEDEALANVRTENFEELAPEKLKKCRLFTFIAIMFLFAGLVFFPNLELAHVDCMEDKF